MRGTKAKRLRRADPLRPNPGRKHGGENKDKVVRRRPGGPMAGVVDKLREALNKQGEQGG